MADLKKSRIVIASVLKPVNDTRMTEKIAASLATLPGLEVHVIGFPSRPFNSDKITLHALPHFKRLSFARLLAPWRVLSKTLSLRAAMLIVTTHELLLISFLVKLTGCKVIYDVQENYYRNILYTNTFPLVLRPFLAAYARGKEYLSSLWIDHFFIAEKAYAYEVSFLGNRFTVLENKVRKQNLPKRMPSSRTDLLFSGTIAKSTGVFKAIELAAGLHQIDRNITLTIIGYCAQRDVLEEIRNTIADYSFIQLIGGDVLVPHDEILKRMAKSAAGIISYEVNASTQNAIPTKLYEYLGAQLPIILVDHKPWADLTAHYNAAVLYQPGAIDYHKINNQLRNKLFYTTKPEHIYWENEEPRLLKVVKKLLP